MIQVYNNTRTSIQAGGLLPFTGFLNRKGCTAVLDNGKISLAQPGIYMVVANFTFDPAAAGTVTITETENGAASAVNIAQENTTDPANFTIPALVRVTCDDVAGCGAKTVGYTVNAEGVLIYANAIVTKVV